MQLYYNLRKIETIKKSQNYKSIFLMSTEAHILNIICKHNLTCGKMIVGPGESIFM